MLLDEAEDTLNIAKRCKTIDIEYNIISHNNNYFYTRSEREIKSYLTDEINTDYSNKDYSKLRYLYFEYYNKSIDDINTIYKQLIESLEIINNNHKRIYELLNMTSNLTK